MEVSDEQRRRMELSRAAAIARRRAVSIHQEQQHHLPGEDSTASNSTVTSNSVAGALCPLGEIRPQLNSSSHQEVPVIELVLELCSPDEFFVYPQEGCDEDRIRQIFNRLSSIPPAYWKSCKTFAECPVFKLRKYEMLTDILRRIVGVRLQHIPWSTRSTLKLHSKPNRPGEWVPFHSRHVPDSVVEELLLNMPRKLRQCLLPFQWEGVRYGLRRGGRVLIADEMGVGKTIQAIAIAACYMKNGPSLVVCPASLRLVWAEELERWIPSLLPSDVHLVFGRKDDLKDSVTPKVVVISYNMLKRLRDNMLQRQWETVIVDESHNLRCSRRINDSEETATVIHVARAATRAVFLSGTPSLSRPFDIFNQVDSLWTGIVGKNKYEFAKNYCTLQDPASQRRLKDFSRGVRLEELNIVLTEAVMIRRLKHQILSQLPPKRRQVIRLKLSSTDVSEAKVASGVEDGRGRKKHNRNVREELCKCGFSPKGTCDCEASDDDHEPTETDTNTEGMTASNLNHQEIGLAKLGGVREWLSNYPLFASDKETQKLAIFGHHHKVLNSLQEFVISRGIEYVRIDGLTEAKDRQRAIDIFRQKAEVKVAIVGVTAGGVGLDLSVAQTVVFVELPKTASDLVQAEDRAHRRGQKNAVNVYIFCAKDTTDEAHWQSLSKSLERVSTMTNGANDAIPGLEVVSVDDRSKSQLIPVCTSSEHVQENLQPLQIADQSKSQIIPVCTTSEHVQENLQPLQIVEEETLQLREVDDAPTGADFEKCDFNSDLLMFEVSSNTGRIHLYKKTSGSPTILEENFKLEDLERMQESHVVDTNSLPPCLLGSAPHKDAAMSFIKEWKALRPIFQKKLYGRPLQLPLTKELSRMKEEFSYGEGGLMRGGSKRRTRPREELVCPLPEGATWKDVRLYKSNPSKEFHVLQAWSADGNPLCKLCHKPCLGPTSKEPKFMEDLFCKTSCFEEYKLKTSQHHMREELFQLERGVCVACHLDCHALVECIRTLPISQRSNYILQKASSFAKHKILLEKLVKDPVEGNAWHADHIVPVFAGGGECNLENMRTLCVVCHAKVTSDQCQRRRSLARKAQRTLNFSIEKMLTNESKRLKPEESPSDSVTSDVEDDDTALLVIEVAGSAYSGKLAGLT